MNDNCSFPAWTNVSLPDEEMFPAGIVPSISGGAFALIGLNQYNEDDEYV